MPFKDSASTVKVMKCRMEHEHGHGRICKTAVVASLKETERPVQTGLDPWQRFDPNASEGFCRYNVPCLR
jgi:hypothetical protein